MINSIHKTLASFTQSAVLNLNSNRVDRYRLEDKLQAVQSTSPSYLLMASLDISADMLERFGGRLMREWNQNLQYAYETVKQIPEIRLMEGADHFDYSKINIDTSRLGITAANLEERLMKKGIFPELTTGNILMLMTGIGNQRQDFEKLAKALAEIRRDLGEIPEGRPETAGLNGGRMPRKSQIFNIPANTRRIALEDAAGAICASSIIPYPPGIPLICPGEKIAREDIEYVRALREAGEKVIGVNDAGQITVGETSET